MFASGLLRRLRFSRQIFLLQTGVVVVLIMLVSGLSAWLVRNTLIDEYGQRALAIARSVASDSQVIEAVTQAKQGEALQRDAVTLIHRTGALFVVITDSRGIRLAHPDPSAVGHRVSTDPSEALAGRDVISAVETGTLGLSVRSKTPVRTSSGAVVGEVSVGYAVGAPADETSRLLILIGVFAFAATLLGLAASWLLSRWLRRLTHGVEPAELTEMVYGHEAVLHGIGEGVLAVDEHGLVSVRNTEAEHLLGVTLTIGTAVDDLAVSPRVRSALAQPPVDNVFAVAGDRVIVVNSRPVRRDERVLGTVVTLRDRTDLDSLTRELDSVRSLTDGLRAARHEFSNRLHTLSGLLQLDHRDEAIEYLQALTEGGGGSSAPVDVSVRDPYLGALLLAKSEQAGEKGVTLRLSEDSALTGPVNHPVAVTTVLGNLLDNALRAAHLGQRRPAWIEVTVLTEGDSIHLSVQDSGPGVTLDPPDSVFEEGVTSKLTPGHGLGLALARLEARRLGGDLWLAQPGDSDVGALFVAALPGTLTSREGDLR